MYFCAWFISYNIMSQRFIHAVMNSSILFFVIAVFCYTGHIITIYLSISLLMAIGLVYSFWLLQLMLRILLHVSWDTCVSTSLRDILVLGLLSYRVCILFSFREYYLIDFQILDNSWTLTNRTWEFQLFHVFAYLDTESPLILAIVVGMWRRQWHPTPVFLPGKSHGWRSLLGYSPWGR